MSKNKRRRPPASKTIVSCLQVLQLLPLEGEGLSPRELDEAGREAFEWTFTRRTLDRYLKQLEEAGLIEVAGEPREGRAGRVPQRWLAIPQATGRTKLSPELSVAMVLLERLAKSLLPPELLEKLAPQFRSANELIRLQRRVRAGLRWPEQVEFVPDSLSRQPACVDAEVLRTLQQALLNGEKVECRYATADDVLRGREPKVTVREMRGLVQRGATLYAVVTRPGRPDQPLTLRLDRFHSVRRLSNTKISAAHRSLQDLVSAGLFDFPFSEGRHRFLARIDADERLRLIEEPLSDDQTIRDEADGIYVRATVRDTRALENYVLSRISHITVIEPESLRRRLLEHLGAASSSYGLSAAKSGIPMRRKLSQ